MLSFHIAYTIWTRWKCLKQLDFFFLYYDVCKIRRQKVVSANQCSQVKCNKVKNNSCQNQQNIDFIIAESFQWRSELWENLKENNDVLFKNTYFVSGGEVEQDINPFLQTGS